MKRVEIGPFRPWSIGVLLAYIENLEKERDAMITRAAAAESILRRDGYLPHAGTWIRKEEAARISRDGP